MEEITRFQHWENIYSTKELHEVGWYQSVPVTSLKMIKDLNLLKTASIIDIGGGDSHLAPILISEGYTNITVLDLSAKAIERAKQRLGNDATKIEWIVSDILDFKPHKKYDCWHDRAAFHFLIKKDEIEKYVSISADAIHTNGSIIIGTFSEKGPTKCSGLNISQYSTDLLNKTFNPHFKLKESLNPEHKTPGGFKQHFTFCRFERNSNNH
ncbi:MAG: class I SAM-dependent methyltransferase [Bacteroidetes bacterium]|nr:class I SAM-dependent methyltransferase [Bacteroidota bacterium]